MHKVKNLLSVFIFAVVLSLSVLSCGKKNFEQQPGEAFKFTCKTYNCEIATPNGTWYKPDQKKLSPDFVKQTQSAGELFRINRTPGEDETKLSGELAKERGLSYFYVNYFLISATDLHRQVTEQEAAKLIQSPNARQSEIKSLQQGFTGFQKVGSVDAKISGIPAWIFEFKGNDKEMKNAAVRVKSAYFLKGSFLFILQALCLETDKDKFFADYDKMVSSFKITK